MKFPVCNNDTFNESDFEYHICPECYWEYDWFQVENPDEEGGANCHSLNQYKKIYQRLQMENPSFSCRNEADMKLIAAWDYEDI